MPRNNRDYAKTALQSMIKHAITISEQSETLLEIYDENYIQIRLVLLQITPIMLKFVDYIQELDKLI